MSQDKLRAFVALDIGAETRARIGALVADLRPELPNIRFVPVEQLHLTLRFFGDLSPAAIATLTKRPEGTVRAQLHRGLARLRFRLRGFRP